MSRQPQHFTPRQDMRSVDFELQYKQDTNLQDVELHHHDFYEIYFLESGDVTYLIEDKLIHVMPGDLLLISPQQLHQVCIRPELSRYERYVLWVDVHLIRRLSSGRSDLWQGLDPNRPGYGNHFRLKPEDKTSVRNLLSTLYQETGTDTYGSDLLQEALLIQLLVFINRLVSHQGSRVDETTRTSQLITQVMTYINLHYNEPLSLEMLAEFFFVSKYHLSHAFNQQVGTSVYQYIQKKRLVIARQLLSQGKRPSEIYTLCGFNDYAGFFRAFKTEYGTSPRDYAQSVRQNRLP